MLKILIFGQFCRSYLFIYLLVYVTAVWVFSNDNVVVQVAVQKNCNVRVYVRSKAVKRRQYQRDEFKWFHTGCAAKRTTTKTAISRE